MRNSSTLIIGTAVAVGITVVAVTAVAQSPIEPTQIVAQQTLTNRSDSCFRKLTSGSVIISTSRAIFSTIRATDC